MDVKSMLSFDWIELESFPELSWKCSEIIKINGNEFIQFTSYGDHYGYKYDIVKNKWFKLQLNIPKDITATNVTSAFDQKTQNLYIYFGNKSSFDQKAKIIKTNLKTNETNITNNVRNVGHSGRGIVLNDQFHMIGGCSSSTEHLLWDGNELKSQFDFSIGKSLHVSFFYFSQPGIAHIPSKNSLLCIGGYSGKCHDWIYLYNTKCKTWTKLSQRLPVPMWFCGCVVSRNQKYVILLGGDYTDTIYVLDVATMKFRKSSIICPEKACVHAINMYDAEKDMLLTFGYIRNIFNLPQCNAMSFPPIYLINIISSYYSNEWIFVTTIVKANLNHESKINGRHWKIKLDDILNH
eukprot:199636_1